MRVPQARRKLSQSKTDPLSSAALRARVLAALARREHSRHELERKFLPLAQSAQALAEILDSLQQQGLLSDTRFAQSVARIRGARFGVRRIAFELQQKGVAGHHAAAAIDQLTQTESDRLREVWQKKFGSAPDSFQEAARQQRFLQQRGFPTSLIRDFFRQFSRR
jgi:regulatory protein